MTSDEIVSQGEAAFKAGEAWLRANGYSKELQQVERHHAALQRITEKLKKKGVIARSGAEGKDP